MFKLFNIYSKKNRADYTINKLTLAFNAPFLEDQFTQSYFETNLQVGRACHLIAVFFYVMVGMWNAVVVDPERFHLWAGVVGVVCSIFLAGFTVSYVRKNLYARYWQQLFALYVVATGMGFTWVTVVAGQQSPIDNFLGLIFCLLFCYTFIRLTFLWAVLAGNFIVAAYIIGVTVFAGLPVSLLSTHFFYIFGINLLGMMVCYSQELMSRRDFMLNDLLRQAENETQNLNIHLEKLVAERTRALDYANQDLKVSIQREQDLVARLEKSLKSLEQAEIMAKLGYFERNRDSDELYCSKGFFKLLGYEDGAAGILTWDGFAAHIHEDDREKFVERLEQSIAGHETLEIEFRLIKNNGDTIQVYEFADHFYSDAGKPLITRGVFQDITDRREAEEALQKIQGQLIQAQKMESIGTLAGGVAHDYNNISSVIMGYAELSLEFESPKEPLKTNLEQILEAAKRATDITRQLLAFARKQTIDPIVIDLNQTVDSMLKILKRLIGEDIDLSWLPGAEIWPVKIDPTQVDQILANLCVNARDAISNVGKITIETGKVSFDGKYCRDHVGFVPGDYTLLAVSDNGKGMDAKILDNIFEPFFTTKEVGQGTGLGLATVYGIVKQNKGFINVYSELDKGTTVRVYLPMHTGRVLEREKKDTLSGLKGKGETVLVVEDDAVILEISEKMLVNQGYAVITAGTPADAFDFVNHQATAVHLLITDVIMPQMNGRELAEQLKSILPELKVLFMSGYTANVIAHHGVLEKGVHFISKPFSHKDLAAKVRAVLDT